jgi:hypothetical protein
MNLITGKGRACIHGESEVLGENLVKHSKKVFIAIVFFFLAFSNWKGIISGELLFHNPLLPPFKSILNVFSDSWTEEEKKNATHFMNSLKAYNNANAKINEGNGGLITPNDSDQIVGYFEEALAEARLVQDSVLDKAHPQLKINFRDKFQKSAELMVEFFKTNEFNLQVRSSQLYDSWGYWLGASRSQIKIKTYKGKKGWADE